MREWENRRERIHGRIWELLPWYVNDTLSERERERVEAHLADCPRCQEEESICRRTAEVVRNAGEVSPSPHPVQFQRMLARIEAREENEREERARGGWRRFGAILSASEATPGRLRMALVAQAAIILLLIGAVVWQQMLLTSFHTLADPAPAPVPTVGLRVVFASRATEREIRDLLLSVQGKITEGPSSVGVYTVAVPAGRDPVEVVLARLRSEPQVVVFAERGAGTNSR